MSGVWRISIAFAIILLLINALAFYVSKRAAWAFALSRRQRWLIGATLALGIAAAVAARGLGSAHAASAAWLGAFGGAVVLAILISSVLLAPLEIVGLLSRLRPRPRTEPAAAPEQPERRAFLARTAAAGALSLGVSSAIYGTLIGRRDYTLETVPIRLEKLPKALDGLTIVQLSDLHVGTFVGERELGAALELVVRAKPDLVVLTGDLLDHDIRYAPVLARFARSLDGRARYGVYAVPGNHDHYAGAAETLAALRKAGAEVLLNRHVRIGAGDASLVLAGVDDVSGADFGGPGPRLGQAFKGAPAALARVLLSHNPAFFLSARQHADLTLSGHTHGGQITLFINPAELVLRHGFVRGHYSSGPGQLYVNRGFGTAGPPARIGSAPEITRLVLSA